MPTENVSEECHSTLNDAFIDGPNANGNDFYLKRIFLNSCSFPT